MLDSRATQSMIRFNITQSKTDHFQQDVHVCLGNTDKDVCSINSLVAYHIKRKNIFVLRKLSVFGFRIQ